MGAPYIDREQPNAPNHRNQAAQADARDLQAYRSRIEELREYGEDEGVIVNEASEKDFWAFVKTLPASRKGSLVLMDNGNLRALWKGERESHLALQFLGGREIQYVIFKRRKRAKNVSRVAGTDTFDGIKRHIDAFELSEILG